MHMVEYQYAEARSNSVKECGKIGYVLEALMKVDTSLVLAIGQFKKARHDHT
jgi:hypothetical protein